MADTKLTFEQSMARLTEIVRNLERGDAPLSDAVSLFEEGAGLISSCTRLLDEAEQKVVMLKKGESGDPIELPFGEVED